MLVLLLIIAGVFVLGAGVGVLLGSLAGYITIVVLITVVWSLIFLGAD